MAKLPSAIQRQIEAADQIVAGLQPQATPPDPFAPAPDNGQPANQPPAQAVAEPAPPAPAPSVPEETWEKKYKTLQGLFNAEVPKLQSANKDLSAQLQQTLERLDGLTRQVQQATAPAPQPPAQDPKDIEDFGQDLVDMVHRQIGHIVGGLTKQVEGIVNDVDKRITALEQALNTTTKQVAENAEDKFYARLTELVPNWEQVNEDAAFHAWLLEEDPVYGVPRQAALTAAQNKLDAVRASKVFLAFKGAAPAAAPRPDPLANQVTPSTAGGSGEPVVVEKPVIAQAQVEVFYRDVAQGKYRNNPKEQQRIEALINAALAEGRIR